MLAVKRDMLLVVTFVVSGGRYLDKFLILWEKNSGVVFSFAAVKCGGKHKVPGSQNKFLSFATTNCPVDEYNQILGAGLPGHWHLSFCSPLRT
jgi:hypothetical protein